ncbi:MAG: hypothetical protein MUF31_15350 [Akkermansiaceae bacterium]|jgi:hypothetical protein|nr:hypothetical protein [Akkermansiaceae bacterium]
MKLVSGLVLVGAMGIAGYALEPWLSPAMISMAKDKPTEAPVAKVDPSAVPATGAQTPPAAPTGQTPAPTPAPATWPAPPEWVAALKPDQLPEKVTLRTDLELPVPGAAKPMTLPSGAPVTPVRVEGEMLVVSPFAGPIEGKVHVMATNLVELLGNQPPAPPVAVVPEPAPMPEPTPAPTPTPAPEPTPTPAPAAELDEEGIVQLMQSDIKGGRIQEFEFEQVLGWKAGETVEQDGETFQSGLVAYKATTIFGEKTIQAQALIKDGKIVKWIWPNSGMEIK